MTSSDDSARGTLGTVRNAMLLLELMSEGPAYRPLSELAQESGLTLPTVHRLLRSLVLAQLVEQEERSSRYGLGPELTRLSQRYLARLPILGALSPYLVPLRDTLGITVQVAILVRGAAVYVDRVEGSTGALYRESGRAVPALTTASGRLLAARASAEDWTAALGRVDDLLAKEAADERSTWASAEHLVTEGTPAAAGEIAVPVVDGAGRAAAALSIAAPSSGTDQLSGVVSHLQQAARAAGRTLGHG